MPEIYGYDELISCLPEEDNPVAACSCCGESLYLGEEVLRIDSSEYYCSDSCLHAALGVITEYIGLDT